MSGALTSTARTVTGAVGSRLTYANVASTLALVAALGTGTAYAADTIRSEDIVNGQVKTVDLGANAVTSGKIKNNGVTGADVKDGSLGGTDVKDGSIGSAEVTDESLTDADLGGSSVGRSEIATDGVGASEVADGAIDGGEVFDNSLSAADLATGSVGSSEIADSSIGSADVATNSLTTADIAGTDVNGSFITLNANAIPIGRCRSFNVPIGGAQPGEAVIWSLKQSLPDGLYIYGQNVPAVNQVRMVACNGSGAAWPQLTNIPIRVVTIG